MESVLVKHFSYFSFCIINLSKLTYRHALKPSQGELYFLNVFEVSNALSFDQK